MRQSKYIVSLSSSFQPATDFYKLINQTVTAQKERKQRLWWQNHSDNTTGCNNKCRRVCICMRGGGVCI